MTQVIHGLTREQLVAQVFDPTQSEADFEKWIMRISHGCADLHKNLNGEYDDPVTLQCLEQYQKSQKKGGI